MKNVTVKYKALKAALSLGLLGSVSLQAQTWDGGGADNNWTTAGNWTANVAPVATDPLTFDGVLRLAAANDFTAATQFNGLTFAASAGAFTLSGNSITLGGNITNNSLNAQAAANALILNADRSVDVASRNGSLALSGVISGTGTTLTKSGSGLITLTGGTNTFTNLTVTGGTVSVAGDGNLGSTTGTINLNGGALRTTAAITLSAGRGITLGSSTASTGGTIDVSTGTTTYAGVLANNGGTNSFTKTGAGQLNLNGVNTYTGETRINQGTVQVDRNGTGRINAASTLVLGGNNTSLGATSSVSNAVNSPTLLIQAAGAATDTQTFNGLTLNQGNSAIAFRSIGATADTLALGAITRNAGGFVNITRLKDLVGSANAQVTTTTANTNGILGGWAVTNADAAVGAVGVATATDWAANNGSGTIIAYTGYTIPTGATPTLANNGANNIRLDSTSTGNVSLTYASNVSNLNTIQMTDTSARTIAIATGNTLRLGAFGGIWKTQGNNAPLTISGGTLTAGGAADTAGEIVLNANATNTATTGIAISSVIADNGTGVVSLTKTGVGSVDINSANTFTGDVYINQGRVGGSNATSFGQNNTVRIQPGGQAFLSAANTYLNNFVIAGAGTAENVNFGAIRVGNPVTIGSSTSTITLAGDARIGRNGDTTVATLAGKITGDFNLEFAAANQGTNVDQNVFLLTNTANDLGGNLGINAVNLGAGQTATNIGNTVVQVRLGASGVIANGAGKGNVFIGGSATANNNSYLDLNGFSETINGLQSAGTNFAQQRVTGGRSGTPAAATLTLGDGNATASFGGIIENGTGTTALTKIGSGTQILGGANTYTGATVISNGTLLVNGSLAAGSAVSIASGATLGGSGTVAGAVTTAGVGSVVSPGNSPGTLTLGSLDASAGATLVFELGTTSDQLVITGLLTGSTAASGLQFNFSNSGGLVAGNPYTIMTFGSVSGLGYTDFFANTLPSGLFLDSSFGTGGYLINGNNLQVQFSTVPEPSTYALLGLGLASLWILRRKKSA